MQCDALIVKCPVLPCYSCALGGCWLILLPNEPCISVDVKGLHITKHRVGLCQSSSSAHQRHFDSHTSGLHDTSVTLKTQRLHVISVVKERVCHIQEAALLLNNNDWRQCSWLLSKQP